MKIFLFHLGKNSNANASLCIIVLCIYSGYFIFTAAISLGSVREEDKDCYLCLSLGHWCASAFLVIRTTWASLVVQWLRLCTPNARDLSLVPRPHMPQLNIRHTTAEIEDATHSN